MKKGLNSGLKEKQENERKETASKVDEAIKDLKEMGFEVSTKLLIERTGLSRPVFGKPHVLEVLKKHKVCRYKEIKTVSTKNTKNYIDELELKNKKLYIELNKLKKELANSMRIRSNLELKIDDLEDTNKLLRGQLNKYYEVGLAHGVNFEEYE
ncbi:DUF6262 family protein [Romboutsia sp. 1001713B170207_170306_H8]|uniref:DUF6262 family protein n=1 Tax=Romboutsia sp. 1001713B170207_170306_H8 TaxID=2787112 RepID=UPI001899B208